jgi:hypothetical protein
MIACPSCGATNAAGPAACAKCGASLAGARPAGALEASRDEALLRELDQRDRTKRRRLAHAFVGAATFFALILLFGLPGSLAPSDLLVNAIVSTSFGAPIGFLISRWNAGPIKGALVSAGAMIVARLIMGLFTGGGADLFLSALVAGAGGLLPGVLIGFHVESDT